MLVYRLLLCEITAKLFYIIRCLLCPFFGLETAELKIDSQGNWLLLQLSEGTHVRWHV